MRSRLYLQSRKVHLNYQWHPKNHQPPLRPTQPKKQSNPSKRPRATARRRAGRDRKPSLYTSTRSWSRSTPKSESAERPWTSWTPSSTTLSTNLPSKLPNWWDSTREERFLHARFKLELNSCSLESWPDMLSVKEPRQSPSTPVHEQ